MAASTTTGFPATASISVAEVMGARVNRRRKIGPEAGHALEILGHAIEYLTDEFVHEGGTFSAQDGRFEAIQLLMAVNRKIYFDCPEIPSLRERFVALLHPKPL